jgi:hypothetical protein
MVLNLESVVVNRGYFGCFSEGSVMRVFSGVFIALLLATSAVAQPWYARGEFNAWTQDNPMTQDPMDSTHWTADLTGLFDNQPYNFKIACCGVDGWLVNMPASDGRVYTDALGELHLHLYDQTNWSDGWLPNDVRRVGYEDHQQFDWEIAGTFTDPDWSETHDPNYYLTDMGNGLHRGTFSMPAGFHEFKFRGVEADPFDPLDVWDTSIGNNFGLNAQNNLFSVANDGDEWTFELDLPNGRFRYFAAEAPELEGDYNGDNSVDAADYVWWRKNDGDNPAGYNTWRANFGRTGGGVEYTWIARSPTAGDETMTDAGGGEFDRLVTGLVPASEHDFQIVRSDAGEIVPPSLMRVAADANGEIDLNFYELDGASWGDGWSPDTSSRVGYEDSQQYFWEIMGSFNGWTTPVVALTDQGNGLHTATYTVDTPGGYAFKFRKQGDWNTSIGQNFGNFGTPDINITTTNPSEMWQFELDLPNGRWRAFMVTPGGSAVPEPASVALLMIGAMFILGVRRK